MFFSGFANLLRIIKKRNWEIGLRYNSLLNIQFRRESKRTSQMKTEGKGKNSNHKGKDVTN